ncbi:MAG: right-handed parallel beta-helix repeat-containing protein [Aquabacterium sp.]
MEVSDQVLPIEDPGANLIAPPPSTGQNVFYVDGAAGNDTNDGRSITKAKRTLTSSIPMVNATVYLKRGTTVQLATNIWPRDTFIADYGDAAAPKPILQVPQGTANQMSVDGGQFHIREIDFRGSDMTTSGSGVNGAKASRLVVENCIVTGWGNSIRFVGSGGIIRGNTLKGYTSVGIYGGRYGVPAPSNYEISYNTIDGSLGKDAISLHDGDGVGTGNRIRSNSIIGGSENGIDILGMYPQTTIEYNAIRSTKLAGIIVSMATDNINGAHDAVIRGNSISRSETAGIYVRADRAVVTGNTLYKMYSTGMSSGIALAGSATVTDNTITVPSSVTRPAVLLIHVAGRPVPSGTFMRNSITSASPTAYIYGLQAGTTTRTLMGSQWNIESNTYSVPSSTGIYFASGNFNEWRAVNWGGAFPLKDQLSTITYTNVNQ